MGLVVKHREHKARVIADWIECLVEINLLSKEMAQKQWNARQIKKKKKNNHKQTTRVQTND